MRPLLAVAASVALALAACINQSDYHGPSQSGYTLTSGTFDVTPTQPEPQADYTESKPDSGAPEQTLRVAPETSPPPKPARSTWGASGVPASNNAEDAGPSP